MQKIKINENLYFLVNEDSFKMTVHVNEKWLTKKFDVKDVKKLLFLMESLFQND